jgi:hypothetical protein
MKVTEQKHASLSAWVQTQPQFTEHERMGTNPVLTDLLARLNALETELDEHLNKWGRTEDHPLVVKTRQRIAELHARVEQTPKEAIVGRDRIPNQSRLQAEQQIQMLAGEQTALQRQIEELQTQLEQYEILNRNYFVVRNDYLKLQREYEEATNQLQFWETNLRQTTIALRAEIGQRGVRLSIIQRAPDQARPSEPTLPTILFAALALGLGTAGLVVFVAEVIDHSFRSVEHAVDDLKLPVLGTVNEILTEQQVLKRKVWNWGVYPSLATVMTVVLLVSLGLAYLSLREPLQFEQLMRSPGGFFGGG